MENLELQARLGDLRLDARLRIILEKVRRNPSASFPEIFPQYCDLEGFYRFVNNPRVKAGALMESFLEATSLGISEKKEIIVIHDTTEICPVSKAQAIDAFEPLSGNKKPGFLAHVSLAVEQAANHQSSAKIIGPLGLRYWTRPKKKKLKKQTMKTANENDRWWEQINQTNKYAQSSDQFIHVADRESDAYSFFHRLNQSPEPIRYVVRLAHSRVIIASDQKQAGSSKLFESLREQKPMASREVSLSTRIGCFYEKTRKTHPPRKKRQAQLLISAKQVSLKRNDRHSLREGYAESVTVNVVRVYEKHPPAGEKPVEWFLCTSEPIDTAKDLEHIVDCYKTRWCRVPHN